MKFQTLLQKIKKKRGRNSALALFKIKAKSRMNFIILLPMLIIFFLKDTALQGSSTPNHSWNIANLDCACHWNANENQNILGLSGRTMLYLHWPEKILCICFVCMTKNRQYSYLFDHHLCSTNDETSKMFLMLSTPTRV